MELLYGSGDGHALAANESFNTNTAEPITIEDVHIFYSLFEVSMDETRATLPKSLHPSVPAAMGVTFWHANDSLIGPFTIAFTALACRTGIKPRHLVIDAYASSPEAQKFFGERYGFNCKLAEVIFRERYDRFFGQVSIDEAVILETEATDALPLVGAGTAVKYSAPLNAVRLDGELTLIQFEAGYDFKRAARGKPKMNQLTSSLIPTYPISGAHAICDMHLMPARFSVDVAIPAEQGGAKKLAP